MINIDSVNLRMLFVGFENSLFFTCILLHIFLHKDYSILVKYKKYFRFVIALKKKRKKQEEIGARGRLDRQIYLYKHSASYKQLHF